MSKFQIIEKIENNNKSFFLKKNIFGINMYQWSFVEFSQTALAPILVVANVMCYNLSPLFIIAAHTISIIIAYNIGRKRYNSIHEAEAVIKNYVKIEAAKKNKPLPAAKNINVLNYNIDVEKGIFEKEFQSNSKK